MSINECLPAEQTWQCCPLRFPGCYDQRPPAAIGVNAVCGWRPTRLSKSPRLTNCIVILYTTHNDLELPAQGCRAVLQNRIKGKDSAPSRGEIETATCRAGQRQIREGHERTRLEAASFIRRSGKPLVGGGQRQLAADFYIRRCRCRAGRLSGLPLRGFMRMHNPPHPGRVLREYLGTMSVTDTARHLGVTRVALSRILNGSAGISAAMALKLSDALRTSPELWTGMQAQYDLWQASQRHHKRLTPFLVAAKYPPSGKPIPISSGKARARAVR